MNKHITHDGANILKILIEVRGSMDVTALDTAFRKIPFKGPVRGGGRLGRLKEHSFVAQSDSGMVTVTEEGLREYKRQCYNRFSPEFFPSGWRALGPLREEFPHSKFQVTGTGARVDESGEVTCWIEVHRWYRTNWLGLILPPKRERFFRFDATYGPSCHGSGWTSMKGGESPQEMLAHFEFTEIVPC